MVTQEESYLLFAALVSVSVLGVFFYKLFEIAKTLKDISRKFTDVPPTPPEASGGEEEKN